MYTTLPRELLSQDAVASFIPVDLDSVGDALLVQALAQHPQPVPLQLVIDCSRMKCLRHLGVSHVVSQLLRQSGARVFLRNVEPVLQRCLHLLRLDGLFPIL
jgi:hypothetical protein